MIERELNPPGLVDTYLGGLNACFPGWGDRAAYAWAFERRVSGPAPDLIVLREGGELLAGSAVSYRTLRAATGARALVGIMTGSWTLPAARGRGCFSRIIEESVSLVRGHAGALLLAYVTEANASFRRLEAAGSALFPTRYLFTRPETPVAPASPVTPVEDPAADVEGWFERFEARRGPGAAIAYASAAEWRSQLLDRPGRTSILEAGRLGFCVVEEHGDTDRLQGIAPAAPEERVPLVRAMLARAQARGRKLFLFSASPALSEACVAELGLGQAPGHLTMLPADPAAASALVGGGPVSREALAQAPAFAAWALHSGDRM